MMRFLYFSPDGKVRTDIHQGELNVLAHEQGGVLWVDMSGEDTEKCNLILENIFKFHHLAVEDALRQTYVPKLDDWGRYLYMVLYEIGSFTTEQEIVLQNELDIFLGEYFLVTYHKSPLKSLDHVWDSCQGDPRYLKRGAPYLFYQLASEMVSQHFPVFDQIEVRIDEIEDQILRTPKKDTLENIFSLKRSLLRLRRLMLPQQEVFNRLARNNFHVITDEQKYFFRDVYDHYVHFHDLAESQREMVASALETYLSATNNRMNEVVKTLTVITTMFMPITFVSTFFGMNFFQKEVAFGTWSGQLLFVVAIILIVLIPTAMFLWMRRKDWM
ncbi:MAG TPA: magnesium/cobalt transporter CorA [Anaerolineales bacterium]|nr:magnesium/cobalt transporter CorA [Anaerolineales bacterium]